MHIIIPKNSAQMNAIAEKMERSKYEFSPFIFQRYKDATVKVIEILEAKKDSDFCLIDLTGLSVEVAKNLYPGDNKYRSSIKVIEFFNEKDFYLCDLKDALNLRENIEFEISKNIGTARCPLQVGNRTRFASPINDEHKDGEVIQTRLSHAFIKELETNIIHKVEYGRIL